ncbi:hypothetical protein [Streptomyces microflavus]|uniref:hypothetical protein n=1 Tax=Streptomyces microflavus TaxID=1919 RepID=UPI0036E751D1
MKVEIARHNWSSLRSLWGEDSLVVRAALLDLSDATSDTDVDMAVQRIEDEVVAPGLLSDSSAAAARCLVHGIYTLTDYRLTRALETLAVIASEGSMQTQSGGSPVAEECLREVCLGFTSYCEILEISKNIDCRSSAIDLLLICGIHDPRSKPAAKSALDAAMTAEDLYDLRDLIAASRAELEQS